MELRILGTVELAGGAALPRGKQRAILALLALRANEVVPTEALLEAVWGADRPAAVENQLQVYVSRLRRLLGKDRLQLAAGGYLLRLEPGELDALRFQGLLADGSRALAAGDPGAARGLLDEALALWHGEHVAEGLIGEVEEPDVARLHELRLAAFEERFEADLRLGAHEQAVPELDAFVRANPFRERARGQLMLALYRAGRQAEALEQYRLARSALVEGLGVEPGPELRRLERAILEQDPALEPPGRRAPSLPEPTTSLVGRERELDEVLALLGGGQRLVTLTGPGGMGKTRLALELARRAAPAFAGAVAFVPLDAIADPLLVAPEIAQALGLKLEGGRSAAAFLVDHLRLRPTLLVLDNLEQVVAAAPLVTSLLAGAPELAVLATSRGVLRVAGEREYRVGPLEPDAAVRLFLERARTAVPGLEAPDEALATMDEICARLDRLPLAIELAAARTQLLAPEALLARLGSLDVLGSGRRDAPERHQALRATIDWSYDLLGGDEQRLFARLAVFVGGWSYEDAEAVCGAAGLLDGLTALVESSLVQRGGGAEPRFSMLNTVRDYALERLAADPDADELRRRHAAVYLAHAEAFEQQVDAAQEELYRRLELDHANVRAALAFLLETGAGDEALRLAAALRRFWQIRGHLSEGRRLLEAALAAADTAPELRARALNGLGILVAQQGELTEAARLFEQSLELGRELGDLDRIATALSNLGNVRLYQGEHARARDAYLEAREAWKACGNHRGIVTASQNLASLDLADGRAEEACGSLETAAQLAREHGDPLQISSVLRDLARCLIELGRVGEARAALAEAYPVMHAYGHLSDVASALELYAVIADADGDGEQAAALLGAAAQIRSSTGAVHRLDQADLVERTLDAVRKHLGEETFAAALAHGERLPLDRLGELLPG